MINTDLIPINQSERKKPMKYSAKNIFFQIMKALCYFCLFLGTQFIVSFVLILIASVQYIFQNGNPGDPASRIDYSRYLLEYANQHTGHMEVICTIMILLFLWLFFLIRGRKALRETNIVKFHPGYLPGSIILGVGVTFFCNTALNLLPESWLESYGEASGSLAQGPFLLMLFATGVCAPILEEVIFRGLILSRLRRSMPLWISICISSLLFGVAHGHPLWIAYTSLLGAVFCVVTIRTGSILPSMLMHAIFNICGICFSYMELTFTPLLFWSMLAGGVILSILGMYMVLKYQPTREI